MPCFTCMIKGCTEIGNTPDPFQAVPSTPSCHVTFSARGNHTHKAFFTAAAAGSPVTTLNHSRILHRPVKQPVWWLSLEIQNLPPHWENVSSLLRPADVTPVQCCWLRGYLEGSGFMTGWMPFWPQQVPNKKINTGFSSSSLPLSLPVFLFCHGMVHQAGPP